MRIAVIDDQPADRETIAALVMCWAKARNTAVTAVTAGSNNPRLPPSTACGERGRGTASAVEGV